MLLCSSNPYKCKGGGTSCLKARSISKLITESGTYLTDESEDGT